MTIATPPDTYRDNPLYELFDPAVRADPYPLLDRWRDEGPIRTGDGSVIVGDYASCMGLIKDPKMGNDTLGAPELKKLFPIDRTQQVLDSIFFLDEPDHGRQRALISKAFTPRITARYEPWIRAIVDDLFAQFIDRGTFDAVTEFSNCLSLRVIGELLGVPPDDIELLRQWSDDLALATELPTVMAALRSSDAYTDDDMAAINRATLAMHTYFADLIHKRRRQPADDLISNLIHSEDNGRRLTRQEVTNVVATLFTAAHESTTNLLSNALLALSRHPDQFALLQRDPDIAPLAVNEVLRYDCPVQLIARLALADTVTASGAEIPAESVVVLLLAAGNRDEAEFPGADRFVADRSTKSMGLAFGAGKHYCLGAPLARLEAQIALQNVATRLRDLTVDEDTLTYRRHVVVRGPETMTVHFQR
jgi:cytochrome P450